MAKLLVIFLVFATLVNLGFGVDLYRRKRQSDDNENPDDNNLDDRYGFWNRPARQQFPWIPPTQTTTTQRSTGGNSDAAIQTCMRNCPVTSEYNPVCGTDNVTYSNPGRLSCAQACGRNVDLMRSAPCPTTTTAAPQ